MSLFNRISSLFTRPELPTRYSDGWQAGVPGLDVTKAMPIEGFAALRRGIEIIVGQLTSTPKLVFDGTEEQPKSAAARCLARTTAADFEAAFYDATQTGNGWMLIDRDGNGTPYRLTHVQAYRMSAAILAGKVVYRCDGQVIDEVDYVHLMLRNGYSAFVGDPIAESYSTSVASVVATMSIYQQLQGNGSFAEVILSTDSLLTREQMTQLRGAYADQTAHNLGKAGGVVILGNGLKPVTYHRLPSAMDATLVDVMNFSVAEASRMTGVPLAMLSVKDANSYNSSVEMLRSFHKATMVPIFHRVQDELSRKLGSVVRFDVGEIALGYGTERADVLSKLVGTGVVSMNEARASMGYSPVPGGDSTAMPANLRPLDLWLLPTPAPAAPKPAPEGV